MRLQSVITTFDTHFNESKTHVKESMTMGSRQYPNTLMVQPVETPVILIKLRNSANHDQTAPKGQSDLGLHCLL